VELDQEMKDDFIAEINLLKKDMQSCVDELTKKLDQPKLFEKFGQTIDRIYGTATTLGFMEFGQYCKALKDLTYMCSATQSQIGQKKVFAIIASSMGSLDIFVKAIDDPAELLKINNQIKIVLKKVETLEKSCFASVKDNKSCA
jgi:chemotaxis protein histidine kinase CheA